MRELAITSLLLCVEKSLTSLDKKGMSIGIIMIKSMVGSYDSHHNLLSRSTAGFVKGIPIFTLAVNAAIRGNTLNLYLEEIPDLYFQLLSSTNWKVLTEITSDD